MLCACVCLSTVNARADEATDKAEAERLFKAGVSLQKAEDFGAAISAFESSLRIHPTKSALFNLANCLQAMHRYPEALSTVEKLERDYGAELVEPMKGRVAIQRAELENLTASLKVEVAPEGAEVRIDGRLVGTAPLGPLRLTLGDHAIEVSFAGYTTERHNVNLSPRENAAQSFRLQPETPAPEAPKHQHPRTSTQAPEHRST
jgi:tetratricopeptide (TPR) repeat protein